MSDWWRSLKPAAPARVHLLAASLMWTVVGGTLAFFGVRWALAGRMAHPWLLAVAAACVGAAKSRFVLDRAAGRVVERIRQRGDGRCLGGFLSLRSWALVILMMVCGRLMRAGLLAYPVVGFVYTAVGTALLLSARLLWRAWWSHPRASAP
jgi:hypothetical protein